MKRSLGVTLFEVLLVLAVLGSLLVFYVDYTQRRNEEKRQTRATLQFQEIFNAVLAYYVKYNEWPTSLVNAVPVFTDEINPWGKILNPWGKEFKNVNSTGLGMTYVVTDVLNVNNARSIVGRLPLAFMTDTVTDPLTIPTPGTCTMTPPCYVVAAINIPPQSLNKATAASFAAVYHSGACVPAPECSVHGVTQAGPLKPDIMVIPVSVTGLYENDKDCGQSGKPDCLAYPISSYVGSAVPSSPADSDKVPLCEDRTKLTACDFGSTPPPAPRVYPEPPEAPKKYWRVCISVATEKGKVTPTTANSAWGLASGTVMAITRCVPVNEETGSGFHVWTP